MDRRHPFGGVERRAVIGLELREADGKPVIQGYAARFEEWSEEFGFGSWKWREKIRAGAFARTLEEYDQRALWNHNPDLILGRRSAGSLKLREDERGLFAEITPVDTDQSRGYVESIRRGDVTGMSFAFRTIREEWDEEQQERTLVEVKLYEVSPTPFPAYPTTSAGVRSLFPDLPDEGAIRRYIDFLRACLPEQPTPTISPVEPRWGRGLSAIKRRLQVLELEIQSSRNRKGNSMRDLNELRRKRGNIIAQMRSLTDTADQEFRDGKRTNNALSSEEDTKYSAMDHDQEELRKEIEREERLLSLEGERQNDNPPIHTDNTVAGKPKRARETSEYESAYRSYLASGLRNITAQELRALQADSDTAGGYVVTPQQFITTLIKAVDDAIAVRQLATKFQVPKAESIGAPYLKDDPADPTWTAEIATGNEDSSMDFGKRELHPHPLAQFIKVSNKLIRVSVLSVDALVRERLAYKTSIVHEKAFLTGSGSNQPLGLFTASSMGITTARDVSTGNTTTAIGADNLFECSYTLKGQYLGRPSTRWIFHRLALKQIRKLKDGNGQYLWQPGLTAGQPDSILGIPVINSEYAPSTFTAGLYVGLLGDLSFYWIVDALDASIQVVDQLYAATNQTGYFMRSECDGMPVLEEAFVRVKLA